MYQLQKRIEMKAIRQSEFLKNKYGRDFYYASEILEYAEIEGFSELYLLASENPNKPFHELFYKEIR